MVCRATTLHNHRPSAPAVSPSSVSGGNVSSQDGALDLPDRLDGVWRRRHVEDTIASALFSRFPSTALKGAHGLTVLGVVRRSHRLAQMLGPKRLACSSCRTAAEA
jgi:hypothetical protein